jgi:hypothetical protein
VSPTPAMKHEIKNHYHYMSVNSNPKAFPQKKLPISKNFYFIASLDDIGD